MKDETIIAYLRDELVPAEKVEVENWFESSGENRSSFERIKLIWDNSRIDYEPGDIDAPKAWDRIQTSISGEEVPRKKNPNRSAGSYLRIAASIVLLLGIGYLSFRLITNQVLSGQEWMVVSTTTDRSEVELPDGTHVWLNKNSEISYPARYGPGIRELQLSGEAFFDVAKNKRKPFIVSTESSLVEVLGTSFNVSAADLQEEVIVSVVTGKVSLSDPSNPENTLFLEAGEKGIHQVAVKRLSREAIRDNNFMAWKTGILSFENSPMEYVCQILSEHFELPVTMDPNGMLHTKRLTATYDNKELEEVLKILSLTLDISCESTSDSITLISSPR